MLLKNKLSGRAKEIGDSIIISEDFLSDFKAAINSTAEKTRLRAVLLRLKQNGGDPITYATQVRNVALRINPEQQEQDIIVSVINGLDEEYRSRVITMPNETYSDLISSITKLMAYVVKDKQETAMYGDKTQDQYVSPYTQCHNCKGFGHLSVQCPSAPRQQMWRGRGRARGRARRPWPRGRNFTPRGRGRDRDAFSATENDDEINDNSQYRQFTKKLHRSKEWVLQFELEKGKQLTKRMTFNRRSALGVIDTGATVTLVHPRFCYNTTPTNVPIVLANGEKKILSQATNITIQIQGTNYKHTALVYDNLPVDVLIGTDFLVGRASIDLIKTVVTIQPRKSEGATFSATIDDRDRQCLNGIMMNSEG